MYIIKKKNLVGTLKALNSSNGWKCNDVYECHVVESIRRKRHVLSRFSNLQCLNQALSEISQSFKINHIDKINKMLLLLLLLLD
jgi:hypothetical protein